MSIKVVIVEDSELIQRWLARMLESVAGVEVIGIAAGEPEAIEMIEALRPDLITLDMALSPGHGLNVLKAVRESGNLCHAIVLTNQDTGPLRPMAMKLGADGLYDKSLDVSTLLDRVRQWAHGGAGASAPA